MENVFHVDVLGSESSASASDSEKSVKDNSDMVCMINVQDFTGLEK